MTNIKNKDYMMPPRDDDTAPDVYQSLGLNRTKFLVAIDRTFKKFGFSVPAPAFIETHADHMVGAVASRRDIITQHVKSAFPAVSADTLRRWDGFANAFPPCPKDTTTLKYKIGNLQMVAQMSHAEIITLGTVRSNPAVDAYIEATAWPLDAVHRALLVNLDSDARNLILIGTTLHAHTKGFTKLNPPLPRHPVQATSPKKLDL